MALERIGHAEREAPHEVGRSRSDWKPVSQSLAHAFDDDPVNAFLFPRAEGRLARSAALYRMVIWSFAPHVRVDADTERVSAAVWQPPNPPRPTAWQGFVLGLRGLVVLRDAAERADRLQRVMSKAHPREPHWYLALLGTRPEHQGRGLGSHVMTPVLDRCDREGLPAYLESSKASNIPFYERHGFVLQGELQVPDGPMFWPMRRPPRGGS